jgi:glycine cleavage system pyridoxal-binding protein P
MEPNSTAPFLTRHIGPRDDERATMLKELGIESLDELMSAAVPAGIRSHETLHLPAPASEPEVIARLRAKAARNKPGVAMIGLGYHPTVTPAVIRRNVLEDPSWYTAYTPYQPEISQGRLEALLNFQTAVADLAGLATANASLLDEATAAAEAMMLLRRADKKAVAKPFVVDAGVNRRRWPSWRRAPKPWVWSSWSPTSPRCRPESWVAVCSSRTRAPTAPFASFRRWSRPFTPPAAWWSPWPTRLR